MADGTTWDFALRPGVTFHDGSPFVAADVAATFTRIRGLKTSLRGLATRIQPVVDVQVLGPHTLRLRTATPMPGLAAELSKVMILRAAGTAATEPEAFNSGREAIGTGPFRFAGYTPDAALDVVRNDGWWDGAVAWRAATVRFIPRDGVRVAALLAGDVDVIERVGAADAAVLAARPGIVLSNAPALAAVYVILQMAREDGGPFLTAADGAALAANPLRDRRVRQALSLAVNRAALTGRLLQGAGQPASQFAPVGSEEHVPGIAPPAQDIARARALLVEAGHGAGLQLVLHGPSDRYAGIAQVAEAMAQMWSRIGIATRVETTPWNTMARRTARGEFAATLFACCSSQSDPLVTARELVATQDAGRGTGMSNWGRYANPELDRMVALGLGTFDRAIRGQAVARAAAIVAEDQPVLLLYHPFNVWAARAPVAYIARKDGQSPAMGARRGATD